MEIRAGWGCQENAVSPDKNRHSRGKSRTCLALRLASCQCKTVWLADQCTPAVFSRYQDGKRMQRAFQIYAQEVHNYGQTRVLH